MLDRKHVMLSLETRTGYPERAVEMTGKSEPWKSQREIKKNEVTMTGPGLV